MNLSAWIPKLIRIWRLQAKGKWSDGPSDRLLPEEARSIAAGIRRLSSGLTRERLLAGERYFQDPVLFGAYLMYFWPVSYAQAFQVLSTLPQLTGSLLDLGCGGGPLTAAAADLGITQVVLADRSKKALSVAQQLLQSHGIQAEFEHWNSNQTLPFPHRSYQLIASQHFLNELWQTDASRDSKHQALASQIMSHMSPTGHFILIEPALKSTSQTVLKIRNHLCQSGCSPVFPCLHSSSCPALRADNSCHSESAWHPPSLIQELYERAGLHKTILKMTALIFQTSPGTDQPAQSILVVGEPKRAKNKQLFVEICTASGFNKIVIAPKNVTSANKALLKTRPGDFLEISDPTFSGHEIVLTAESKVLSPGSYNPSFQIKA